VLSIPLFWEDFRENKKILLLFGGGLVLLALINLGIYAWISGRADTDVFFNVPEPLLKLLGLDLKDPSLTAFLGKTMYEGWSLVTMTLLDMILSVRLVADQMERRSMIYYIGSPLGRKKVIFTQGYFLVCSQFVLITAGTVGTLLLSELLFPGVLEIPQFLLCSIGFFFLHMLLGGIGFFFSCYADNKKQVYMGNSVIVLFLLFYMAGKTGGSLFVFRYLSVISLYEISGLLKGSFTLLIRLLLLILAGGIIYWLGMRIFLKKDLHLAAKHQNSKGL